MFFNMPLKRRRRYVPNDVGYIENESHVIEN